MRRPATSRYSFNGASGFYPRKCPCGHSPMRVLDGFNGASGFYPRKCNVTRDIELRHLQLQWGLGFLPEEMGRARSKRFGTRSASMGPRVFTRGNGVYQWPRGGRVDALQWGLGFLPEEITTGSTLKAIVWGASMGPRVFTRGNGGLGWVRCCLPSGASMGPRVFTRGNQLPRISSSDLASASMGPRVFTRGNFIVHTIVQLSTPCFNGASGFYPRKFAWTQRLEIQRLRLQWGLGFLPEEISAAHRPSGGSKTGFNGASGFYPRKSLAFQALL